uniref:B-cell receptor CD22-like isoform X2 n=1 Tax=Doryrhamphus excisus TaxID=161450 RepID=UPI0025AEC26F|nr:B-cell receptor CD22-like isoform X2 [Doryrhamphus excisus]
MNLHAVLSWMSVMVLAGSHSAPNPFELTSDRPSAKAGSCIQLTVQGSASGTGDAYWFWIKDAIWDRKKQDFNGTVVLSSDPQRRPVHPDFAGRVQDGTPSRWRKNILICNLTTTDSGSYRFRYVDGLKWVTPPTHVHVEDAPSVEIRSGWSTFRQGEEMVLTCNVTRSNPAVRVYSWSKDGNPVGHQRDHVVGSVQPEHAGSYTCEASNEVGGGTSAPILIQVEYRPRNTKVLVRGSGSTHIKVNTPLVLQCQTDANPPAIKYSWSLHGRHIRTSGSSWPSEVTADILQVSGVQRRHEACYLCDAANRVAAGDSSPPLCLRVLYPPGEPLLSMAAEALEGEQLSIVCSAESFPPSNFTLTRTSGQRSSVRPVADSRGRNLSITLNVTSADDGVYACEAANSEGKGSTRRLLRVLYSPKHVTVTAQPGLEVGENASLTLRCGAMSHPPVTSVTWWRLTDGGARALATRHALTVQAVSPSDAGLYGCTAANDIGTGRSTPVKVKYPPKLTEISKGAELRRSDGLISVTLSCGAQAFPPIKHHLWYKMAADGRGRDEKVSDSHNHTVTSDRPGVYYCVVKNDAGDGRSEPVSLFLHGGFMKALKFLLPLLSVLLVLVLLIFYVYRQRRTKKKLLQDSASRRTVTTDSQNLAGRRAEARAANSDHGAATGIHTIYSLLSPPLAGQDRPSAADDLREGRHPHHSVPYASLRFRHEPEKEAELTYAVVSRAKRAKKTTPADSSQDEVELNYSQVNFKPKSERSEDTELGSAQGNI